MRPSDVIDDFDIALPQLMQFYGVETKDDLIMVQASQIERLQKRLRDVQPPQVQYRGEIRGA